MYSGANWSLRIFLTNINYEIAVAEAFLEFLDSDLQGVETKAHATMPG